MSEYADIVLQSNCIFTASGSDPFAGYVAVRSGRILSVGEGACPRGLISDQTICRDLGNRTVAPGFSDVHCFFTGYSAGFVGVSLTDVKSCEEIVERVKEYAGRISAENRCSDTAGMQSLSIPPELPFWTKRLEAVRSFCSQRAVKRAG